MPALGGADFTWAICRWIMFRNSAGWQKAVTLMATINTPSVGLASGLSASVQQPAPDRPPASASTSMESPKPLWPPNGRARPRRTIKIGRVRRRLAAVIDGPAQRNRLTRPQFRTDFSFGSDARGNVEEQRIARFGGDGQAERIGREPSGRPAERRDPLATAAAIDHHQGRHSLPRGVLGIGPDAARMSAIVQGHHGRPGPPGTFDGDLHRAAGHHLSETLAAIEPDGGQGLVLDPEPRVGCHPPRLDGLDILRDADDAVRSNAAKVGVDQMLGHDSGGVRRHSEARKISAMAETSTSGLMVGMRMSLTPRGMARANRSHSVPRPGVPQASSSSPCALWRRSHSSDSLGPFVSSLERPGRITAARAEGIRRMAAIACWTAFEKSPVRPCRTCWWAVSPLYLFSRSQDNARQRAVECPAELDGRPRFHRRQTCRDYSLRGKHNTVVHGVAGTAGSEKSSHSIQPDSVRDRVGRVDAVVRRPFIPQKSSDRYRR